MVTVSYCDFVQGDIICRWLRLLCQVTVGLVLLSAGVQKIFVSGVASFASDLEKFRLLPQSMIPLVAYLMPWWEVLTGICLMLDYLRKGALASAILMTLAFCAVIGWAWSQGLDISCGCFGKSDATIVYPWKFFELLLQLAALIFASSGPVIAWRLIGGLSSGAEHEKS